MAFTSITVTATYKKSDGTAASGQVSFVPSSVLQDSSTHQIHSRMQTTVTLDSNGSLSTVLVANDDTTTVPTGSSYLVTEVVTGALPRSYSVIIPHTAAGGTIDLSALAPTTTTPSYAYALLTGATFTGTVNAALYDAGGQVYNVYHSKYGAKGDGVTDDTAAIQSCANDATAAGGTLHIPHGTFLVSATLGSVILTLNGPCRVYLEGTIKIASTTPLCGSVFAGTSSGTTDYSGLVIEGPGTIDANCTNRNAGTPNTASFQSNSAIGDRIHVGKGIKVRGLRFTNFDSIWVVNLSSNGTATMSDVEVSGCQFDHLGTTTQANGHDNSVIYVDAVNMHVHGNRCWQAAPGATTFAINYGARTFIELHGDGQHCHDNQSWGMWWGIGNLWASSNSSQDGLNSSGHHWHNNQAHHCGVGIDIGTYKVALGSFGLRNVNVHDNLMEIDANLWGTANVAGSGINLGGIRFIPTAAGQGTAHAVKIHSNLVRVVNQSFQGFSYTGTIPAGVLIQADSPYDGLVRDWDIESNTLIGVGGSGVHIEGVNFDGIRVRHNPTRNLGTFSSGVKYAVYFNATGYARHVRISDTHPVDDQVGSAVSCGVTSNSTTITTATAATANVGLNVFTNDGSAGLAYGTTIVSAVAGVSYTLSNAWTGTTGTVTLNLTTSPYGYNSKRMTGPVFMNYASGSNDCKALDIGYSCDDTSTFSPVAVGGSCAAPYPFIRGTSYTKPTAGGFNVAAGSEITVLAQRNGGIKPTQVYQQTACDTGSGGQTWTLVQGGIGNSNNNTNTTIAAGAGAGTGPTVTLSSTSSDLAGLITVTTGSGPTAPATVATVTFGTTMNAIPRAVIIEPANALAAALSGNGAVYEDQASRSTGGFVLKVGSVALSGTYLFSYLVVG